MKICLYGAANEQINKEYIKAGESLGEQLALRGHTLVFGGGSGGLMGAAARGAKKSGGKVIGIAPRFFNADGILFDECDEWVLTDTLHERKQKMEESDGFIVTPGGIGTFDELFEALALKKLDRHKKPIAVLNTLGYYDPLVDLLNKAENEGFIPPCGQLYFCSEEPSRILDYLEKEI